MVVQKVNGFLSGEINKKYVLSYLVNVFKFLGKLHWHLRCNEIKLNIFNFLEITVSNDQIIIIDISSPNYLVEEFQQVQFHYNWSFRVIYPLKKIKPNREL